MGLIGITFGTIYQKKYCAEMDQRTGSTVQFGVAALLVSPLSLIFEDGVIHRKPAFIAALSIWRYSFLWSP